MDEPYACMCCMYSEFLFMYTIEIMVKGKKKVGYEPKIILRSSLSLTLSAR